MKIILDKYEYAKIIRDCEYSRWDHYDKCEKCALKSSCEGKEWLEYTCKIKDENADEEH